MKEVNNFEQIKSLLDFDGKSIYLVWLVLRNKDGNTEATRTITVTGPVTYTAIFDKVAPRAWAYDLRKGEDGENYTFTFKTTSAGTATLIFKDKNGNTFPDSNEILKNPHYYYGDKKISKKKFNSYLKSGNKKMIQGTMSYSAMKKKLKAKGAK
jgi:hypothetical protein